ncbi:MAG: LysR family transcriptional regulator [Geminicoccaceae bacterium]
MKKLNWEDLRIFFHVAQGGGLSAAARQLDISVPTAGRRMLALEEATGRSLFLRSQSGYTLTKAGEALFSKVRSMEAAARPLEDWLSSEGARPLVRISAGTGTAGFLATNFTRLWQPDDPYRLAFVTTEARLDIAHREIEIGIRNRPAESGNLASRKLQQLRFAPFRNRHRQWPGEPDWVAIDASNARHPAAHWVLARDDIAISAWANSAATLRDMIRGGAGIGVMPCFIGDRDPVLVRAGGFIEDLTETQWLVMHDDDRHRKEVRIVIDRITALFSDHAALLAGERPLSD